MSDNAGDVSEVPEAVMVSDGKESSGWLVFAAMMMFGLGFMALMAAFAEALNGSWLLENTLLGARIDWFWYGFFDLLVAIGSFYAGWAILSRRAGGYMLGFIFATLSAARWFLLVPIAPLWSVTMVVLWVLVVYALIKTADYEL